MDPITRSNVFFLSRRFRAAFAWRPLPPNHPAWVSSPELARICPDAAHRLAGYATHADVMRVLSRTLVAGGAELFVYARNVDGLRVARALGLAWRQDARGALFHAICHNDQPMIEHLLRVEQVPLDPMHVQSATARNDVALLRRLLTLGAPPTGVCMYIAQVRGLHEARAVLEGARCPPWQPEWCVPLAAA